MLKAMLFAFALLSATMPAQAASAAGTASATAPAGSAVATGQTAPAAGAAAALATGATPWDAFGLLAKENGGITYHYEDAFSQDIAFVADSMTRLYADAESWKRRSGEMGQGGALFDEIDKIVGPVGSDDARLLRKKVFDSCMAQPLLAFGRPRDIYLVRREAMKNYLRAGGALPHFTYDKSTDQARYSVTMADFDGTFVLPIDSPAETRREVSRFISDSSPERVMGTALRQAAQMTIIQRLKPADGHLRWFYDGFAAVVAERLLASHMGKDAAANFATSYSTGRYQDMEKDINLRYWLSSNFEVDTPLSYEPSLEQARQAFARLEADRLVQAHGIKCLKAILDKVPAEGAKSATLFAAVRDVTGEDMEARLARYQRFATLEDGHALYMQQYTAAGEKHDPAAALSSLLRVLEVTNNYNVEVYAKAAQIMILLGREDYGYRVFATQLDQLHQRDMEEVRHALELALIDYALRARDSSPAEKVAEDVLTSVPDYVPALVIRMRRYIREQNGLQLIETARRVVALDTDTESANRKYAQYVLEKFEAWRKTQPGQGGVESTGAAASSVESSGASSVAAESSAAGS